MSSNNEECNKSHNDFCFVCGSWLPSDEKHNIYSQKFTKAFENHFKLNVFDRNVQWSPSFSCNNCYRRLLDKVRPLKFFKPVIWIAPSDHPHDCYFCNTEVPTGINKYKRKLIKYPNPWTVSIVNAEKRANYDGDETIRSESERENDDELPTASGYMDVGDDVELVEPTTSTAALQIYQHNFLRNHLHLILNRFVMSRMIQEDQYGLQAALNLMIQEDQ